MTEEDDRFTALIVQRELHSSRAIIATLTAAVLGLAALYMMLEAVLKAIGQDSWLLGPEEFGAWAAGLPGSVAPLLLGAGGGVLVVLGLLFFLGAVLPGRRARYAIPGSRAAVVVDAEVLAAALARRARLAAGVSRDQVLVSVARSDVRVQLRPTSGRPVDKEEVIAAVEEELRRSAVQPLPRIRVSLSTAGVIGQ